MDEIGADGAARSGLFGHIGLTAFDWQVLATSAGEVGRWVFDPVSGLCELDPTLRRLTGLLDRVGAVPADDFIARIDPEDRDRVRREMERAVVDGVTYDAEFRFQRPSGETIHLSGNGRTVAAPDGATLLVGVNYDITEIREAQQRAELLAGEMAHRVKNIFALVQSIFNMAVHGTADRETLIQAFSGRLHALAAANTLIFEEPDTGVLLQDLVERVVGPVVETGRLNAAIDPFRLSGPAAQTMVLVLHELMTNAMKHGALSTETGAIDLNWTIEGSAATLSWRETWPGPVARPEGRGGFGTRVLERMSRATFSGTPTFDWHDDGLHYRCRWPVEGFGHGATTPYSATLADDLRGIITRDPAR